MSVIDPVPVPPEHQSDCFFYVGFIGVMLHDIVTAKTHEEARVMAMLGLRKLVDSGLPFEPEIVAQWRLALAGVDGTISSNGNAP